MSGVSRSRDPLMWGLEAISFGTGCWYSLSQSQRTMRPPQQQEAQDREKGVQDVAFVFVMSRCQIYFSINI